MSQWAVTLPASFVCALVLGWGLIGLMGVQLVVAIADAAVTILIWKGRAWTAPRGLAAAPPPEGPAGNASRPRGEHASAMEWPSPPTLAFLRTETGAGVLLALAAVAGLVIANSHGAAAYRAFVVAPETVRFGPFAATLSVEEWVRDGLMTLFFLVVGLEVKYEVLRGEFSSPRRLMAAPVIAAFRGMAGPTIVYLTINSGLHGTPAAWAIPTPTDVAFSLAALGIFGRGLPQSLRLFVLTLAVADDISAVILIAVLYHQPLHAEPLAAAGATLAVLAALSRWRRAPRLFYAAGFPCCAGPSPSSRASVPRSLGFACALTTPIDPRRADQESLLQDLHGRPAPLRRLPGPAAVRLHLRRHFDREPDLARRLLTPAPLGVALGLRPGQAGGDLPRRGRFARLPAGPPAPMAPPGSRSSAARASAARDSSRSASLSPTSPWRRRNATRRAWR